MPEPQYHEDPNHEADHDEAIYQRLREQVEGLITENRSDQALAQESVRLESFWQIGDALTRHLEQHPASTYGQAIVSKLSKDIQIAQSVLYDILRFRRLLPTFSVSGKLRWSHYRTLLHLPDIEQFRYYESLATEGDWTARQLRQAIDADTDGQAFTPDDESPGKTLRARFGELSTYRIVTDPWSEEGCAIDFGFHQVWQLDGVPGFEQTRAGDTISLHHDVATARPVTRDDEPRLWTYAARVRRVIDGDTLSTVAYLGWGHLAFPRLRLRGIDTPELYTLAGRRAKQHVEAALADAPCVVITTWRTDTYGRYLADLKYLPGESDARVVLAQGIYLNRELLDQGLATRYVG